MLNIVGLLTGIWSLKPQIAWPLLDYQDFPRKVCQLLLNVPIIPSCQSISQNLFTMIPFERIHGCRGHPAYTPVYQWLLVMHLSLHRVGIMGLRMQSPKRSQVLMLSQTKPGGMRVDNQNCINSGSVIEIPTSKTIWNIGCCHWIDHHFLPWMKTLVKFYLSQQTK